MRRITDAGGNVEDGLEDEDDPAQDLKRGTWAPRCEAVMNAHGLCVGRHMDVAADCQDGKG